MSNLPEYFELKGWCYKACKDVVVDETDAVNESTLRIQSHAHSDH